MATTALEHYKILIADADLKLAQVLKSMLEAMGFSDITLTRSGMEALALLKAQAFDFLVTEWDLEHMGGLELMNRIRRGGELADPSLPIIMLTGRGDQADVVTARDYGMSEYVLKPFSAKAVFSRLERLIEQPRNFVVSQHFVGPDRRFKGQPPEGAEDRRTMRIAPQARPEAPAAAINGSQTQVWAADMSLRKKLGAETSLSSLITPAALESAQAKIEAISSESLLWIQENLNELAGLYHEMTEGEPYTLLPINMSEVALTISSRAGTFGFAAAAKVAYMLHTFCLHQLRTAQKTHHIIAEKHLDALKAILHNSASQKEPRAANDAVVKELQLLVEKLAA